MYKTIKRFFDIILSTLVTLVLAPLLVPIMVGLRFTAEGEVWYKQKRIGFNNKPFLIWKFATMLKNSSKMKGGIITTKKDSRITPMGGFLRKSKINELPQLINILKGDMSFVGPRPALFNQDDLITLRTEKGVHELIPGLTGWAQINGRDELPIPKKVELDAEYLHNQSLRLDIKIIWVTFIKVLIKDGVSH